MSFRILKIACSCDLHKTENTNVNLKCNEALQFCCFLLFFRRFGVHSYWGFVHYVLSSVFGEKLIFARAHHTQYINQKHTNP